MVGEEMRPISSTPLDDSKNWLIQTPRAVDANPPPKRDGRDSTEPKDWRQTTKNILWF